MKGLLDKSSYNPPTEEDAPPPYSPPTGESSKPFKSTKQAPWWKKMFQSTPATGSAPPTGPVYHEDELHLLKEYDTFFVVDDSSSMRGEKWREASRALQELVATATEYDDDGIDLAFLNHKQVYRDIKDPDEVDRIFAQLSPVGGTPTGHRLGRLLTEYLDKFGHVRDRDPAVLAAREKIKPINYIVITDGSPTDDPAHEIERAAKRLDDLNRPLSQVGIQFIQIGNAARATNALQSLDDELKTIYKIRDIVDTTPFQGRPLDGQFLIKALLGGINRRWDRQANSPTDNTQKRTL